MQKRHSRCFDDPVSLRAGALLTVIHYQTNNTAQPAFLDSFGTSTRSAAGYQTAISGKLNTPGLCHYHGLHGRKSLANMSGQTGLQRLKRLALDT